MYTHTVKSASPQFLHTEEALRVNICHEHNTDSHCINWIDIKCLVFPKAWSSKFKKLPLGIVY